MRALSGCREIVRSTTSARFGQQPNDVHDEHVPTITFQALPTDTEHNRRFRTHLGYQRAFRSLALGGSMRSRALHLPDLAHRALTAYGSHITRRPVAEVDEGTVRATLRRSWGAETILCVTADLSPDADMTRLALAWGSVQTYYACYAAVQANLAAEGKPLSDQHNTTQKQAADYWAMRKFDLAPWSLAAVSPGTPLACSTGFLNGPGRPLDLQVHAWAEPAPGTEWDLAGKALRTTRNERVEEAIKRQREQKRRDKIKAWKADEAVRISAGRKPRKQPSVALPRLTTPEKTAVDRGMRPFTLLDYLFRLRIKANYLDDDMFSQGPDSDTAAQRFASGMIDIVTTTLLVHELRLGKVLGPSWVLNEVDAWLNSHSGAPSSAGLAARRPILAQA